MRSALVFAGLLVASAAGAQTLPEVPQTNLRYDEDWSVLGDAAVAPTGWKAAKYRPMNEDGTVYLSTGFEARARYEGFDNNNWGDPPAPDDGYLWLRLMPHADLHAGPVRIFAQGIAGYARGVGAGEGPADETGIDLLQGFADMRVQLAPEVGLTFRVGRALIGLGSERLVGLRYGPNIPQAFDGGRVTLDAGGVTVDAMLLHPVAVGPDDFDDRSSDAERLGGIYATIPVAEGIEADLYWLDYRNNDAHFVQGSGREERQTYGIRLFGVRGSLEWNWEAMLQGGRLENASIRAWSATAETSYGFSRVALRPRLRLRASVASGDDDAKDERLGTFNAMFPKGKYFGELSPIGPQNIITLQPSADLNLGSDVTLTVMAAAYWRARRGDGLYNVPGQILRTPGDATARFVGSEAEAALEWKPNEILSFALSLSVFAPGDFIRQTGPARPIRMIGTEAMLRF